MTADERVEVANSLWRLAREAVAAGVRARHPSWPDDAVNAEIRRLMSGAGA